MLTKKCDLFITKPQEVVDQTAEELPYVESENQMDMNEEMNKAHQMIHSGMQKVKQLRMMVSETKQSLIEQKRLQYLENMYRDKIYQDQQDQENKISYVEKK